MRIKIISGLVVSFIVTLVAPAPADMPLVLQVKPMEKDRRGTDVRLIREITVDVTDKQMAEGPYDIIYSVDGAAMKDFSGEKLPFTFLWNFKGLKNGTYSIRIEVVQPGDKPEVLGKAEQMVEVMHREKGKKNKGGTVAKPVLPNLPSPEAAMAQLEQRRQELQNVGKGKTGLEPRGEIPEQKPFPKLELPDFTLREIPGKPLKKDNKE